MSYFLSDILNIYKKSQKSDRKTKRNSVIIRIKKLFFHSKFEWKSFVILSTANKSTNPRSKLIKLWVHFRQMDCCRRTPTFSPFAKYSSSWIFSNHYSFILTGKSIPLNKAVAWFYLLWKWYNNFSYWKKLITVKWNVISLDCI